jgi:hypothetical protein
MKTMQLITGLAGLAMISFSASAQETDDMYFNRKDREKLKTETSGTTSKRDKIDSDYKAFRDKHFDNNTEATEEENVNPTDSYSSRQVNPEYTARTQSEQASEDEANYFVEGYTPPRVAPDSNNSALNTPYYSNYYGNGFNNPYYARPYGYYGNGYGNGYYDPWCNYCNNAWGSPYYNSFYSPYGWSSGWSISIGYGWGNYYNPYNPYNNWYNPYYGGYYPGTVIVVRDGSNNRYRGKYVTRNSRYGSYDPKARTNSNQVSRTRVSSNTRQQEEYYNSRRSAALDYQRRYSSGESNNNSGFSRDTYRSNTGSNTNRSTNVSNYNNNSRPSSYTPSRSSSGSFSPSRSGGGSSGSGRSRGGN